MIAPILFAIALAGDWTGTSLCTNREVLPACRDEVVLYHFTKKSDDTLHLAADKKVDGKWQSMGEFDLTLHGSHLTNEMVDRQGRRSLWDFEVKGDRIDGTLKMLPGGEVARRIAVKKVPAAHRAAER